MTEEAVTPSDLKRLDVQLDALHLSHVRGHYQAFATTAAQKQLSHLAYLAELIEGEAARRESRAIERRIKNARFPVLKTMEDFEWNWPKKINRPQIQNLFRLAFIADNTNVVFISTVGLGKTHCAIARVVECRSMLPLRRRHAGWRRPRWRRFRRVQQRCFRGRLAVVWAPVASAANQCGYRASNGYP